ncbi:MAG: hypothetical protein ACOCZQ_03315 [Nanoarchaeota archaeon]
MKQKYIENLIYKYAKDGLLNHPSLTVDIQRKAKRMNEHIPVSELQGNLNYYRVLPLCGQLEIYNRQIGLGTLSEREEKRLEKLENLYQKLHSEKPYKQVFASDLETKRKKFLRYNPDKQPKEFLRYVLIQNGFCYADKRKLEEIVDNFHTDTIFSTTIVGTLVDAYKSFPDKARMGSLQEKDKHKNPIRTVGKYMVCIDKYENPVLAVDHYSFGDYHSRKLKDWDSAVRLFDFAYGPAAAMYFAKKLGINKIVYCDLETEEFVQKCGVKRRTIFNRSEKNSNKNDGRKVGIIAVPDNSKGVWTHGHSIFNNSDGRYFTLDYEPLNVESLEEKFRNIYIPTLTMISQKKKLDYKQINKFNIPARFQAMNTILRIAEDIFLTARPFKTMKNQYNTLIDTIRTKNQGFVLPYVK